MEPPGTPDFDEETDAEEASGLIGHAATPSVSKPMQPTVVLKKQLFCKEPRWKRDPKVRRSENSKFLQFRKLSKLASSRYFPTSDYWKKYRRTVGRKKAELLYQAHYLS
jgi:hypothetical protein